LASTPSQRNAELSHQQVAETAFEKRRGISRIELREGFAQVHVSQLGDNPMERRIAVLDHIAHAGVSIDFLKLTPSGLSCVVPQEFAETVSRVLETLDVSFTVRENRHIVLVHAVNIRDEEGLIADVMAKAIGSGVTIEHITDMHDRMLMVAPAEESGSLVESLQTLIQGGGRGAL
jgi:aspartokinase